jgi:oligopeptide transport system permease protein
MTKKAQHEITRQMFEQLPLESSAVASSRAYTTFWKDAWRRLKKNRVAMASIVVLILITLMAIFAPMFSRYDYAAQDIFAVNKGPTAEHLFGTDNLGRDIFTRCWVGARVSLTIALVATVINVLIGVLYGGISGYFGGKVDLIMMRGVEIIYTIPDLLWVILLMVVMGPGLNTIIISIAITGWGSMARLVRGQILQLKSAEYVMASRTLGGYFGHIIVKHMIPNIMGPIIIDLTFSIPSAIFAEATLSYLGMGIPVPLASWGTLANDGAKILQLFPYQLFFPALLISLTMLGFNLLGDGLRDAFDPKLRH